MTTLFKTLDPGGRCRNGGSGSWHLPKGNRPGKWMPKVEPVLCMSGYHVCTARQLLGWLGPEIWIVEVRGVAVQAEDKSCYAQARIIGKTYWCDRVALLFAADCAEKVLPIFENLRPGDDRPRKCIATTRKFAMGVDGVNAHDLAAAGDAARDAAGAAGAAGAAAGDAAGNWQARRLRSYLVGDRGRKAVSR